MVIVDYMLVRRFESDNVIPEPKHAPENGIVQETEVSRPINVVNQLFGGDSRENVFRKDTLFYTGRPSPVALSPVQDVPP